MKKMIFTILGFIVIALLFGCQSANDSLSLAVGTENSLKPDSTVSSQSDESTTSGMPDSDKTESTVFQQTTESSASEKTEIITFWSNPEIKLSLGMRLEEVKNLLSGLKYSYEDHLDLGYDEMTDEVSAIIVNDKPTETVSREYYLGFSSSGVLSYIIWTEASNVSEEILPYYIAHEMLPRNQIPLYTACEYTDIFVFETEGGYFTQTHFKLKEMGKGNSVNNRLSIKNNTGSFPDKRIPSKVYLFGDALIDGG